MNIKGIIGWLKTLSAPVLAAFSVPAALVLLVVFTAIAIYTFRADNWLVYQLAKVMPFPAAKIDGDLVSYGDYLFELRALQQFQKASTESIQTQGEGAPTPQNPQVNDDQIREQAWQRVKERLVLEKLAAENDVVITKEQIDKALQADIEKQGGEAAFKDSLQRFYNWGEGEYRRFLATQLLQQTLPKVVLPKLSPKGASLASDVQTQAKNAADFSQLARTHSHDSTSRDSGGDLGFISANTPLPEEVRAAALALEPGRISDVVNSEKGFHIIKVLDKQQDLVRVQHILITYDTDLAQVVSARLQQAKINQYVRL